MAGFICKPEVEANRDFIVDVYGVEFYVACLEAEGEQFLSLLVKFKRIWVKPKRKFEISRSVLLAATP